MTMVVVTIVVGVMTTGHKNTLERWLVPNVTAAEINTAWRLAETWAKSPAGQVRAGILPHHALVSPMIAGWFLGAGKQSDPSTVVIIGPDHNNAGAGYMTTAINDWQTPDGAVRVNASLVAALQQSGDVLLDPALIRREHGVYTVIPYVRRAWPSARIVTIAIKGDLRSDRLQRLAQRLDDLLGPTDIVIASVDFSHDRPARDALTEDAASLAVVARGDVEGALRIPVDSPPAISLILRYQKIRGLKYQQLAHTTSAQFVGEPDASSTTSYLSAYFMQ